MKSEIVNKIIDDYKDIANYKENDSIYHKYSYKKGNDVLYDLCHDFQLHNLSNKHENIAALSAQLWLIGRAYAASPERRNYKLKEKIREEIKNNHKEKLDGYDKLTKEKIELKSSGDGLDTFFDRLAEKILTEFNESNPCFVLDDKVSTNEAYNYDLEIPNNNLKNIWDNSDIDKLKKSITCVLDFNLFIKECIFDLDYADLRDYINYINKELKLNITLEQECLKKDQNNILSFCSKFLHFHYPNTVFIMDSITKSHFKRSKSEDNEYKYVFNFKDGKEEKIEINDMFYDVNTFVSNIINDRYTNEDKEKQKKQIDIEKEYIMHCAREYILATYIYNKDDFGDRYVPRIIDTFMLMANT